MVDLSKPFVVGVDVCTLSESGERPTILQEGNSVYANEAMEGFLTEGKHYVIKDVQFDVGRIVIIDDTGREGWYNVKRFRPFPF